MLGTLPYADLLSIHNALAEKPARRFDTRTNGEKHVIAQMETRGLSLEEAARLANVVLGGHDGADRDAPVEQPAELDEETLGESPEATAPEVAFLTELTKPERPAWLDRFLRRLNGGGAPPSGTAAPRERQMTPSQRTIVELCVRPEGATGKELAQGRGWPSIAARATCRKLAIVSVTRSRKARRPTVAGSATGWRHHWRRRSERGGTATGQ